jgi:hypothetical protein
MNMVNMNGTLVEAKICTSLNLRILSLTSVPFTLTTVQVPNFALTHTKRIAVNKWLPIPSLSLSFSFVFMAGSGFDSNCM